MTDRVIRNAEARERARCIADVEAELELPGPMPDHIWNDLVNKDRDEVTRILRTLVRSTKQGIIARIRNRGQGCERQDR